MTIPTVTLANGVAVSQLGFGVYQIPNQTECARVVCDAIGAGYRLIDTAASYFNEEAVGSGIRASGVPRDQLFVTTKVWVQDAGHDATRASFERQLALLGLDYLDLYLIHQPLGDYYGSWRAMEELLAEGRVRAIGVCNFSEERLQDLCLGARVAPMVNQVEVHPFCQRPGLLALQRELGVAGESWGPFAEGKNGLFTDPVLTVIGEEHGKTAAQVALRWNLQKGQVVLAKSTHRERMEQNLDVLDFELSDAEMEQIHALDLGRSSFVGHSDPATVRMRWGLKVHE